MLSTVLVSSGMAGLVAAVSDPSGYDPLNLIPTVTPAVVVGLLVAGVLRTAGEVKRLESINRLQAQENQELRRALVDDAVPALTRTGDMLVEIKPILAQVVDMLRDRK